MQIGQKVSFIPATAKGGSRRVGGVVVWVHPAKRFALVEYTCPPVLGGPPRVLRECLALNKGAADTGK